EWTAIIALGIIGTFLYHAFFFTSLQYTTAINSSLIGATNPMVTTILAVLFFEESMTGGRLAGILLSFLGVFLIITNGDWGVISNLQFNHGDILMFIAVCCWAAYSVLGRSYMAKLKLSPLKVTAYTFLVCVIVSFPFFLWEKPMSYLPDVSAGGWIAVVYMAVFASVLGYFIQLTAIQEIGAPKAAMFINLVPVFTIILSVIFLKESFTLFKLICAGLIITGVFLATRPVKLEGKTGYQMKY
ncbi:MAG: DMT family transporter, partial [Bacillota bacterium]|nr:DMT family transporter [Bacillota bacterium]